MNGGAGEAYNRTNKVHSVADKRKLKYFLNLLAFLNFKRSYKIDFMSLQFRRGL